MKLGGLFSGVGGFELAWTQLGHEVAWMCEWDAKARKVLEARFPSVPIYEDVRDLDPAEVEAVDVLTGGSPCQGFSVAGSRTGLEHSESQLFADYIRIMDGLAERGLQYAIWENVPGVLSIQNDDGERTFNHVVAALAGGTEPVRLREDKRWNTGMAAGRGRAVAWRVLDSRYFGVAQRRRRLFACVAFGHSCEDRAGRALLAVGEGVRGHSSSGVEAGKGVAGGVASGVGGASGFRMTAFGQYEDDDSASTLKQRDHKDATDLIVGPSFGMIGASGQEGATVEEQPAITASHGQPGNVAVPAVLMTMREGKPGGGKGPLLTAEESLTLATGNGQTLFQPKAFRKSARVRSAITPETWVDDGLANTINTFDVGDVRTTHAIIEPPKYGVRRLTPVECERLQAFPDGWTEPAGSDSARYKAMGNAVTVNTVRWILGRILEQS